MSVFFGSHEIVSVIPSSKMASMGQGIVSVQRQPVDPLYWANITLQNVVTGSRYWIAQSSNMANILATGVSSGGDIIIPAVPALEESELMTIRIRKKGYVAFETYAYLYRSGVPVYVIQQPDPIAQ